ncbi:PP2C family protein-serine/threonine phosphatase [Aeromicrobium terrae]|uniref:GAF domain-containing protein n=1 Tax=Aeromicrobium terrae TaxID=2498846 RepID=A0A5C8NGZ4_9ACTN|nr:GAF domain-containing SpoIIE family protein phosphatase [Aeromicrobium terrae]TXL57416.1 GAF domain-containing protein [Aeromicrobium terrae]
MSERSLSFADFVEQVRSNLSSDTASLLLMDESRTVLEPAASAGLGGQWRGATHVRLGRGFAGRVAESGQPVFLDHITPESVLNPILRDSGVHSLLGVPVEHGDLVLGVLHVGSKTPRRFDDHDRELLEKAAAEIAQRLTRTNGADDHTAALALQRSLLPAAPPLIEGLDVAVRYLPSAGDVGGDWYDIFTLPGGDVALVMGDVQGHGLRSAVVMGRLRSALRAYALETHEPAEILRRLDRKLTHFETGTLATVALAITRPPFDSVTLSLAGHPAPVLARPGEQPAELEVEERDLMLGVDPETPRTQVEIPFPVGTALGFYTDGLIDLRPGTKLVTPRAYRMQAICGRMKADQDAETICSRMVAVALGDEELTDDVALMVVRHER